MYADDIILFKFFYPFDAFATCSALNKNLKFITEWSANNSLNHLNSSKSSLLIVGSSTLLSRIQSLYPDISLNSVHIPRSSFIKILGVHVDSSWIFESYVPVKCRACLRVSTSSLSSSPYPFLLSKTSLFSIIRYFIILRLRDVVYVSALNQ